MTCGICGGGTRIFTGVRYGRPITDWKHTDVPPGTQPHRPVLGTPVDEATLDRIHRPPEEVTVVEESTTPLVLPRPAAEGELDECGSALQILRMLEAERWALIEPPAFFVTAKEAAFLVVKARRGDLGAVASWIRRPGKSWAFEEGYALRGRRVERVGSTQLKEWIRQREEYCPECGASSAAHGEECAA